MIPLASDEFSVPAQERIGPDDSGQFVESFATEDLTLKGQTSTLVVVEQNPTLAELFSQHLILSQQILDRVLLVADTPHRREDKFWNSPKSIQLDLENDRKFAWNLCRGLNMQALRVIAPFDH